MSSKKEECKVCIDKYTNAIHKKKIQCNYCEYNCCVSCAQTYLLSQASDAHCMNCRTGWNREFIDLNMTKTFRTKDWREHKKVMILNREKAILPTMQRYAAAKKMIEVLRLKQIEQTSVVSKIQIERSKVYNQVYTIKNRISNHPFSEEEEMEEFKKLDEMLKVYNEKENDYIKADIILTKFMNQLQTQVAIYNNTINGEKEKKEFVLKCVKEGCRGFLSTAYKCELCATYVCKDCMIPKKEKDDTSHVCKKEDIDTVAMIRKDTKPCPKCGIRISKIDGCDQMWCVAEGCGTAFSWNTGKVVSGVVHNPHYYEWVRRNNNGVVPRNPGDNACNDRVQYFELFRALRNCKAISIKHVNFFSDVHRFVTDIQEVRIPMYPHTRNPDMFKELHCDFLLNKIDEATWKQSMFLKENNFEKKQQIGMILNTFVNIMNDSIRNFYNKVITDFTEASSPKPSLINDIIEKYVEEFEQVRIYINDSLVNTGKIMLCAVPQIINDKITWIWQPITKVEKILEQQKTSK